MGENSNYFEYFLNLDERAYKQAGNKNGPTVGCINQTKYGLLKPRND